MAWLLKPSLPKVSAKYRIGEMAKKPLNVPVEEGIDFNPVVEQGLAAKAGDMDESACPYAEGEYRNAWMSGFWAKDLDAAGLVN